MTEFGRTMGALSPHISRFTQYFTLYMKNSGKLLRMTSPDEIDRRIVDTLRVDGRISVNDLAERIGLSPSPTLRRLRRLEDDDVILGYRATIDPAAIARGFSVWVTVRLVVVHLPRSVEIR